MSRSLALRAALIAALLLLLVGLPAMTTASAATPADSSSTALTGNITGPMFLGESLTSTYDIHASGGPAFAANGTQVGTVTFTAVLAGSNTTTATIAPASGVLEDGVGNVSLTGPNVTESLTINVEVTSSLDTDNATLNLSYTLTVLAPYQVTATLLVSSTYGTQPFPVTVSLDGSPVGSVEVPSLTSHTTYKLSYAYVIVSLAAGWHTFTLSLGDAHGLVVFANGATTYSVSFYVAGAPPDYTALYVIGGGLLVAAIFIWLTFVNNRRRRRSK
ncbi:MAG: hypothetical protein L3K03_03560 [Thermoplasmata archaeon]|nr:hypothetical protein [Thermoplasmata archaeon]